MEQNQCKTVIIYKKVGPVQAPLIQASYDQVSDYLNSLNLFVFLHDLQACVAETKGCWQFGTTACSAFTGAAITCLTQLPPLHVLLTNSPAWLFDTHTTPSNTSVNAIVRITELLLIPNNLN